MSVKVKIIALICLVLAGAVAVILMLTKETREISTQQTAIVVYMETTVTTGTSVVSAESSQIYTAVSDYSYTDAAEKGTSSAVAVQTDKEVVFPININTAGIEELMALPGIGETIANRILAYREACGVFTSIEQLSEVEGIGEKRLESISGFIYIEGYISTNAPVAEEDTFAETETTTEESVPAVIDVNDATAEDFDKLPGVDLELGENIVELRTRIKGFSNIRELLYAEGMTREIFIGIMDFLECDVQNHLDDSRND